MLDDIVNRICGVDKSIFMDEVSDNEVEHIDGPFATVWTPYRFYEPEEGKANSISPLRKEFCSTDRPLLASP